jgi:hypothetical protein
MRIVELQLANYDQRARDPLDHGQAGGVHHDHRSGSEL